MGIKTRDALCELRRCLGRDPRAGPEGINRRAQEGGFMTMMRAYFRRLAGLVLVGCCGTVFSTTAGQVRADGITRADVEASWNRGWEQLSRGEFDSAAETFRQASRSSAADERIRTVSDWMAEYTALQEQRQQLRQGEFDDFYERTELALARNLTRPLVVPVLKPVIAFWEEQERQRDEDESAAAPADDDEEDRPSKQIRALAAAVLRAERQDAEALRRHRPRRGV